MGSAPPNPMVLLGDIGQREEVGEGAADPVGVVQGKLRQQRGQICACPCFTAASGLGQSADLLDQGEEGCTFPGPEHGAEDIAQQADIVSERGVGIGRRAGGGCRHSMTVAPGIERVRTVLNPV